MDSTLENPLFPPALFARSYLHRLFAFPQAFEQVKQMYAELKRRTEQSPALGEQGSRVQSINLEAQALFEETLAMMLRMESKILCDLSVIVSHTGEGIFTPGGVREINNEEDKRTFGSEMGQIWAASAGAVPVNVESAAVHGWLWMGPPACSADVHIFLYVLAYVFKHSKVMVLFGAIVF